jgi:hypothetical protein
MAAARVILPRLYDHDDTFAEEDTLPAHGRDVERSGIFPAAGVGAFLAELADELEDTRPRFRIGGGR